MTKIKMPIQDLENKLGNLNKNQQEDFKEEKNLKIKKFTSNKKYKWKTEYITNKLYKAED